MELNFNVTGTKRKELVNLVAHFTGCDAHYLGAPSFAYKVDCFTIDKNGCVTFNDNANSGIVEQLIERLCEEGFTAEGMEPEENHICVSMPRSLFTDVNLENLKGIIAAKGNLIKKALGVDDLLVEITDTKVSFPWFPSTPTPDELKAYDTFICKLCEMARNQKRVVAKGKTTGNEKYAFRCFLLRLGFIGDEYKTERKILLRNLTGSAAFRSCQPSGKEAED